MLYDSNGTPRILEGNDHGLAGSLSLGPVFAGAEPAAVSVVNPAGGGVSAWPSSDTHGVPAVAVREDFPEGGVQTALLAGGASGEVAEVGAARSGLGDALVGFREGPLGDAAIVVAHVTAPPAQFVLSAPKTWVRPRGASVSWQPAPTSDPPLRYQVVLDGRVLPTPAGAFRLNLSRPARETGSHTIQVLASNPDGEATLTPPAPLRVDSRPGRAPRAATRAHAGGRRARQRVGPRPRERQHQLRRRALCARARAQPPHLRPRGHLSRVRPSSRSRGQRDEAAAERARLMTRRPGLTASVLLALACGASATSAPARADVFGPISLASESPVQQADYSHDPAISGDGRYVAFDGSFGGASGVWRRDLQTGAVEAVAGGDAQRPSISQDGRFISFTTTARLTGADQNEAPDVYVRDMSLGSAAACSPGAPPCAFELASAVDGGEEALSYATSSGEATRYGSLAAGRSAISADGRKVVFVTTAVSDLVGPRPPQAPTTPAMQLALRDLDTHTTQLVTTALGASEPQPVSSQEGAEANGGVYAVGATPPPFAAINAYEPTPPAGAAISADGTTVAWLGVNIAQQAAVLSGETLAPRDAEPLWRRVSDGPLAPTRRISGGSDPLSPACAASGETRLASPPTLTDPCQGPFSTQAEASSSGVWTGGIGDTVPVLSRDGYTVAFLANAPLVAFGSNFGRTENNSDVYVADMHPGLTRVQALRPLSELAGGQSSDVATNAPIVDLGISADGTQVAFTTKRTVFALGTPGYVSPPAAVPGMVELFSADLADETLTRVTHGFAGGASEHQHPPVPVGRDPYGPAGDGALSPSYSSDGETLAFSSTADNLVFGDGNTPPLDGGGNTFDGSDAFVVHRVVFSSSPPETGISAAPALPALTPPWRLLARAKSHRDGSVTLALQLPGSGTIQVTARGGVRAAGAQRGRKGSRLASRVVAAKLSRASTAGKLLVTLRLRSRYLALAGTGHGLPARLTVTFSSPGHPVLHARLEVRFVHANRHKGARRR